MNKRRNQRINAGLRSLLLVVSIMLLAVGCNAGKNQELGVKNQEVITSNSTTPTSEVKREYIKYQGVEGRNALDLLKESQKVTVKSFDGVGEFVNGINGVESDSKHFWSFYVNGAQATVGAGSYATKASDVIEWKFEAIK